MKILAGVAGAFLLVVAIWYADYRKKTAAVQRSTAALAGLICKDEAFRTRAQGMADALSGKTREAAFAERDAFLVSLDRAVVDHGGQPKDLRAWRGRVLGPVVSELDEKIHEGCPQLYNERKMEVLKAAGMVVAALVSRTE